MTPRSGLGAVGLRSGSGPSPPPEVASRGQWWTVGVGPRRGRDLQPGSGSGSGSQLSLGRLRFR